MSVGSPFLSTKINEAKDLLGKRARSDPHYNIRKKQKELREADRKEREERRALEEKAI